jgi:hypothetical protein
VQKKPTFLGAQFRYLCQSFSQRERLWHRFYFFFELICLPWKYVRLCRALRRPGPGLRFESANCVVVLLSHNRPQNLDLLVKGALQNRFVSKVIVSNSNPGFRIADWITGGDSRLTLVDETQKTLPGHRFVLADREGGERFLSIDDDILLTPEQWARFFKKLLLEPGVPHGLSGHLYLPGTVFTNGSPFHHRENTNEEVDVLIGAYAFTRAHLDRVFRLAEALQLGCLSDIGNGEDILLSFTGISRPRIHDLGHPLLCASTSLPGVALWKTREAFWNERSAMLDKIREARLGMNPPWRSASLARKLDYSPVPAAR